ncbi:MAG: MBL fold metallo-hydrolase [Kofleriaceae bacterium]|nr:MBL fold metallo-hydrolase [Kofleriaceae bacterium]MCB9575260.1 MBL fold metallo-hydrolase [Kofleriaceae bacterium]
MLVSLGCREARPPASTAEHATAAPITLTYLGVAGWQVEAGGVTILADPYFSRPAALDDVHPLVPDAAAIAAHSPARADLIVVGHSHADHLLDAPAVALRTGAQIMGSRTTTLVARASGVPDDHLIGVRGGEDLAFDGYAVRVVPSLHSMIGDKHVLGTELTAAPTMPMPFDGYAEGGTLAYLIRVAGHEVLILDTANFIEREVEGLRPDVAIVATGLREQVHDYTCRLLRALGAPPVVIANHFDDWRAAPVDPPVGAAPAADLQAFVDEVARCAPGTRVVIPRHFEPFDPFAAR